MITHPTSRDLFLLEGADVARDEPDPDWPRAARDALPAAREIHDWARAYLSRPHPELGRPGPVCPYVPGSLRAQRFWVTACGGTRPDRQAAIKTVLAYRDWFLSLEPRDGGASRLKTILVLFPDVSLADAPAVIDGAQRVLKPHFVREGLMVGEFHPVPPRTPGLWNHAFRPLRSPVPLLAMRHMVSSDLPFLIDDRESLAAYLRRFSERVPAHCRARLAAALADAA